MSKKFLNFLTIFTLMLGTSVFSQSLPSSLGTVRCQTCTPNANWTNIKGTPDVSDRNIAAATGTTGGGAAWIGAPLPLPPNNHEYWITLRDLGNATTEAIIETTITGLTVGREYEILIYSLTAQAAGYSPTFNDSFDYQLEGLPRVTVNPITQNSWGINKLRFTAAATSKTLRFYPGFNAIDTSNYESVNISVTLNALNAVPVAVNDYTYTTQGVPVSINVTSNDSDPDGAIVVSTVDLDPTTSGIQNSVTTVQGIWTVNNVGGVTFTPAVGFSGMATLPYTIQDNFVLDGVSTPSTSLPANISILVQAPFASCSNVMYLTQYAVSGGTELYSLNNVTNPLTITQVGVTSADTIQLNGIGYNPIDNYIYGMNYLNNHLYRMDSNGNSVDLGIVSNLPAGLYISGDIDTAGNYYVKENSGANTALYRINISTKTATLITLSQAIVTADFAYSKADGLFYGVNQLAGANVDKLYSINPTNGAVSFSTQITGVGSAFGAMYTDGITGAVYGNLNSTTTPAFYRLNKTTGVATRVSGSISATGNDGAHCVNAPIQFGVDLAVTKDDGKTTYNLGTTNVYTVVVSNAGPFTALSSVVTDLVPVGIPAANVSYTAVASAGSTTSVVGTQTGAINDIVNIQVGGTITYTITLIVPVAFSGPLVNTATVKASADNVETNLVNNSATDTDIEAVCYNSPAGGMGVATNHGITVLQRAGADNDNWPMVRSSAHTVLESNTKGFVITRMTTAQINAIVSPQEGMMVYDTDLKCLKINSNSTTGGWSCFTVPTCP